MAALGDLKLGVVGAHPVGHEARFEVRAFVPSMGVSEDPVTGSLNAGLAQWLIGTGMAPPSYIAAQGAALPTQIEWQGRHPAAAMPESGVTLRSLALHGVPDAAHEVLQLQGAAMASATGPARRAVLATPGGDVTLES